MHTRSTTHHWSPHFRLLSSIYLFVDSIVVVVNLFCGIKLCIKATWISTSNTKTKVQNEIMCIVTDTGHLRFKYILFGITTYSCPESHKNSDSLHSKTIAETCQKSAIRKLILLKNGQNLPCF